MEQSFLLEPHSSLLSLLGLTQVTPSCFWKLSSSTDADTHRNAPLAHSQGRDKGCLWGWLGSSLGLSSYHGQQRSPKKLNLRVTWPEALSLLLPPGELWRPAEGLAEGVMANAIHPFNLDPLVPQEDSD